MVRGMKNVRQTQIIPQYQNEKGKYCKMQTYMKSEVKRHKISVIIPCYNVEDYLEKCLKSLVNQNFLDYDIIAINDGSTDNTEQILNEYSTKYPGLVYSYTKQNGGLSSARNFGNKITMSDYITYVDSDDYVAADFLERLYEATDNGEKDIVLSGREKVNADGIVIQRLVYNPPTILRRLTTHGVLYKRTYMQENHMEFPDGKIYEDNPFNLVMLFMTKKLEILSYSGYYQLVRNNSITAKKIREEDLPLDALRNAIDYLDKNKNNIADFYIYEHTVISFMTYFIFQANKSHLSVKKDRKSDISVIKIICEDFEKILVRYFPNCKSNPYIRLINGNRLSFSQRIGVWTFVRLHNWKLLTKFAELYYLF